MFQTDFVRGNYYRGDREIVNIIKEVEAEVRGIPCYFCGSEKKDRILMLPDIENKVVHLVPSCSCLKDRVPEDYDNSQEWVNSIDVSELPQIRMEPGPIFRFDVDPALIEGVFENLPATVRGQLVEVGPESILFDFAAHTVVLFHETDVVMLTKRGNSFIDELRFIGNANMKDLKDLREALQLEEDHVYCDWAKELLMNRARSFARARDNKHLREELAGVSEEIQEKLNKELDKKVNVTVDVIA